MPYEEIKHSELIELGKLAGISTVPGLFGIVTELLALQVPPEDIYALLGRICRVPRKKQDDLSRHRSDKIKGN